MFSILRSLGAGALINNSVIVALSDGAFLDSCSDGASSESET
jgi:hypothetical protein